MPVDPNLLERLVLLRLNKGPAPMLDLFGAASFESVTLALKMDVFDTLAAADGPLTASELADRTDAHPDVLAMPRLSRRRNCSVESVTTGTDKSLPCQ